VQLGEQETLNDRLLYAVLQRRLRTGTPFTTVTSPTYLSSGLYLLSSCLSHRELRWWIDDPQG